MYRTRLVLWRHYVALQVIIGQVLTAGCGQNPARQAFDCVMMYVVCSKPTRV